MKKKDLEAAIDEKTWPTLLALAQLYLFPDNINKMHWRKGVWANFHRVVPLKSKNKYPSTSFIFESSWIHNRRNLRKIIQEAIGKEDKFEADAFRYQNWTMFEDLTFDYFEWLSKELSKNGIVEATDVYAKLAELGL